MKTPKKWRNWIPPACLPASEKKGGTRWNLMSVCEVEGCLVAQLIKSKKEKSFGMTISGGTDKDYAPYISNIRAGGLAERCDYFCVDDTILEINDKLVTSLQHMDIIKIVQQAGDELKIKTKYRRSSQEEQDCQWRRSVVSLNTDGPEFSLKGGISADKVLQRPLLIQRVLPASATERLGVIFPGDQLISVNSIPVSSLHLSEVNELLNRINTEFSVEIEYLTSQIEPVPTVNGMLMDIKRLNDKVITGITLGVCVEFESLGSVIVIAEIREASSSYRNGYLSAGDLVLAINGVSLEGITLTQASQMLSNSPTNLQLEIIQARKLRSGTAELYTDCSSTESSLTSLNKPIFSSPTSPASTEVMKAPPPYPDALNSNRSGSFREKFGNRSIHFSKHLPQRSASSCSFDRRKSESSPSPQSNNEQAATLPRRMSLPHTSSFSDKHHSLKAVKNNSSNSDMSSYMSSSRQSFSSLAANMSCRCELMEVVFECDGSEVGLQVQDGMIFGSQGLVVVAITPGKAAERCGTMQLGDRIRMINNIQTTTMTCADFHSYLNERGSSIRLLVEFDIADSVIPSKGTFELKVRKTAAGSGLSLHVPSPSDPEQYLRVLDIKKGSPLYRLGMVMAGDQIISIDGQGANKISADEAYQIMELAPDPVRVTIKKDEQVTGPTFAVELVPNGEPLGISLSGSENPFEVTHISSMSLDGIAYKSGAINVGDQLFAINGTSLRGKTLPQASELLNKADNTVKLLIKRKALERERSRSRSRTPTPLLPLQEDERDTEEQVLEPTTATKSASQDQINDPVDSYRASVTSDLLKFESESATLIKSVEAPEPQIINTNGNHLKRQLLRRSNSNSPDNTNSTSESKRVSPDIRNSQEGRLSQNSEGRLSRNSEGRQSRNSQNGKHSSNSQDGRLSRNSDGRQSRNSQDGILSHERRGSTQHQPRKRVESDTITTASANNVDDNLENYFSEPCQTKRAIQNPSNSSLSATASSIFRKMPKRPGHLALVSRSSPSCQVMAQPVQSAGMTLIDSSVSASKLQKVASLDEGGIILQRGSGFSETKPKLLRVSSVEESGTMSDGKVKMQRFASVDEGRLNFEKSPTQRKLIQALFDQENVPPSPDTEVSKINFEKALRVQDNSKVPPQVYKRPLLVLKRSSLSQNGGVESQLSPTLFKPNPFLTPVSGSQTPTEKGYYGTGPQTEEVDSSSSTDSNKESNFRGKGDKTQQPMTYWYGGNSGGSKSSKKYSALSSESEGPNMQYLKARKGEQRTRKTSTSGTKRSPSASSQAITERVDSELLLHRVTLRKHDVDEDFGFSVSDSFHGVGVYIRSIRHGTIAAEAGKLKKYDRILQVNGISTKDFTCEQLVPFLQNAGRRLDLIVERKVSSHRF